MKIPGRPSPKLRMGGRKLGHIQRAMLVWLQDSTKTGLTVADFCESIGVGRPKSGDKASILASQRYYAAARSLKVRGLIDHVKNGNSVILTLTPEGHTAAYAAKEEMGQIRLFR